MFNGICSVDPEDNYTTSRNSSLMSQASTSCNFTLLNNLEENLHPVRVHHNNNPYLYPNSAVETTLQTYWSGILDTVPYDSRPPVYSAAGRHYAAQQPQTPTDNSQSLTPNVQQQSWQLYNIPSSIFGHYKHVQKSKPSYNCNDRSTNSLAIKLHLQPQCPLTAYDDAPSLIAGQYNFAQQQHSPIDYSQSSASKLQKHGWTLHKVVPSSNYGHYQPAQESQPSAAYNQGMQGSPNSVAIRPHLQPQFSLTKYESAPSVTDRQQVHIPTDDSQSSTLNLQQQGWPLYKVVPSSIFGHYQPAQESQPSGNYNPGSANKLAINYHAQPQYSLM